jgi:hypothetical protein
MSRSGVRLAIVPRIGNDRPAPTRRGDPNDTPVCASIAGTEPHALPPL